MDWPNATWLWLFLILSSGRGSSFHVGWKLGGREADRSGYRQRTGRGGGPGSDPQGTEIRAEQSTVLFTKYQRCNVTFEICLHIKHLTSKPTVWTERGNVYYNEKPSHVDTNLILALELWVRLYTVDYLNYLARWLCNEKLLFSQVVSISLSKTNVLNCWCLFLNRCLLGLGCSSLCGPPWW